MWTSEVFYKYPEKSLPRSSIIQAPQKRRELRRTKLGCRPLPLSLSTDIPREKNLYATAERRSWNLLLWISLPSFSPMAPPASANSSPIGPIQSELAPPTPLFLKLLNLPLASSRRHFLSRELKRFPLLFSLYVFVTLA